MDAQCGQLTIRIAVNEFCKRRNSSNSEEPVIWHPLDRLEGHVVFQSSDLLAFDEIDMHLEGCSRVWMSGLGEDDLLPILKASKQFLSQSYRLTNVERVEHTSPLLSGYIVPFYFVIPKWAITKGVVPAQCLNLPPSISIGQTLPSSQGPEVHAQPNISYHLRALVKYRFADAPEVRTLEAWKEIKFVPTNEILPPSDLCDFPSEFIEAQAQNFRTSILRGPAYTMTLSTSEPSAIIFQDMQLPGTTSAELSVDVKAAEGNVDEDSVDRLPQKLEKLTFDVETIFRAKTFYSTSPFRKMPGQTMLTPRGKMRIQDEIMKLATYSAKPDSWQYLSQNRRPSYAEAVRRPSCQSVGSRRNSNGRACASSSLIPAQSWCARICVPLDVPANLPPTFCSALVARQYSLITQIKVKGINIKPFLLEVPIQVVYSPPAALQMTSRPQRSRDPALDVENSHENLPRYS